MSAMPHDFKPKLGNILFPAAAKVRPLTRAPRKTHNGINAVIPDGRGSMLQLMEKSFAAARSIVELSCHEPKARVTSNINRCANGLGKTNFCSRFPLEESLFLNSVHLGAS